MTLARVLTPVRRTLLAVFGFQVAIGVLIYWTTTNVFSMAQQAVVMRHLGPPEATLAAGKAKAAEKRDAAKPPAKPAKPQAATANGASTDAAAPPPAPAKRPANRNTKNRGKGRRGGRR